MTMEQFVDLCILLGCDYTDKIRGVGPKSAFKLMQEHGSIEEIIKHLDKKHSVPESFPFQGRKEEKTGFQGAKFVADWSNLCRGRPETCFQKNQSLNAQRECYSMPFKKILF